MLWENRGQTTGVHPESETRKMGTGSDPNSFSKLMSGELRVKDAEKLLSASDAAIADTRVQRVPAPR
jgi:hypothetical protein